MNEDSETIEIDGSTAGGDVEYDEDGDRSSERHHAALDELDSTLTPSATLIGQQSAMEAGVSTVPIPAAADGTSASTLMKNSKSVGHFLHCLLPGEKKS